MTRDAGRGPHHGRAEGRRGASAPPRSSTPRTWPANARSRRARPRRPRRLRHRMDFTYPAEAEAFRAELRGWLDEHLTDEIRAAGPGRPARPALDGPRAPPGLEPRRSPTRGYAAIAWPEEYGRPRRGRDGPGRVERGDAPLGGARHAQRARAPQHRAGDHRARHRRAEAPGCCPGCRRGDDIWCQGFSEPDAGSDLASLRTSAVRDGDDWIINGQKTWNTLGHIADWCELLVRTDPDAPKHKGITCLLVDMDRPGVEVRPLVTITGENEFNEIFFDDVRVPFDQTLGPVDEGWRVAMTTLAHERGGVAKLHLGLRAKVGRLIDEARRTPLGDGRMATDDPVLRARLARALPAGRAAEAHLRSGDLRRAARASPRTRGEHRQAGVERDRAVRGRGGRRRARPGRQSAASGAATGS